MLETKNPTDGGGRGGAGEDVQRLSRIKPKNSAVAAKVKPLSSTERSRRHRAKRTAASPAVAATVAPMQRVALGLVLTLIAVLLAGTGMTATISYSLKTAVGADRFLLAALAAAADMLTLMLPSAAVAVWRTGRRGLALVGVLLWLAAAGITATNLAGFLGVNGDAFLTGRETAVAERTLVLERVARLRNERAAITETRPVGVITVAIRNATRATSDDQRAALAIAKRRDAIDAELVAVEATIPTLPAVNAVDPSGATISAAVSLITGVSIATGTLQRARLALLLALPGRLHLQRLRSRLREDRRILHGVAGDLGAHAPFGLER